MTKAPPRFITFIICCLTTVGPMAMDMYLPALPSLQKDLATTTSLAQATVSACLVGLALGQILVGPLSDRFGRKRPVLAGVAIFAVVSFLCALAADIQVLIALRFIQGLAGAAAMVLAQAIGRDVYSGKRLARFYGFSAMLSGLAAIVSPVIGGQLTLVTSWRGLFVILAGAGLGIALIVLFVMPETLDRSRSENQRAGLGSVLKSLFTHRAYLGVLIAGSASSSVYFAYLAGAPFIFTKVFRLESNQLSLSYALNAAGIAGFGYLAGRLTNLTNARRVYGVGLFVLVSGVALVGFQALLAPSLALMFLGLFAIATGSGVLYPPGGLLSLNDFPDNAGAASSIQGTTRFAVASIVAPLAATVGVFSLANLSFVLALACSVTVLAYFFIILPAGKRQAISVSKAN